MNTRRTKLIGSLALSALMVQSIAAAQHGAGGMAAPERSAAAPIEDRPTVRPDSWEELFVKAAHKAHGYDDWPSGKSRALRVTIEFENEQDNQPLRATMWYHIDDHHVRIEAKDGLLAGRDENGYWMMPGGDDSPQHSAQHSPRQLRRHLASWPYLIAMPFRMLDENNLILRRGFVRVNDARHYAAVVNITRDRSAAQHHWYMPIVRGRTGRLEVMLHYCDPDRARPADERVPIAVAYHDYQTFEGVELATRWMLHEWTGDDALGSSTLGRATLSEIAFVDADDASFNRPEEAASIDPPPPPVEVPEESDEAEETDTAEEQPTRDAVEQGNQPIESSDETTDAP